MLEASDSECIEQVSPFLGGTTDEMSGNEREPELKKLFTSYADLFKYV